MAINIDGVYYDCNGACINDLDGDGICDELEIIGCQDAEADNYNLEATDAGPCIYYGCIDVLACNYDSEANTDDGSCWYPDEVYLDCNGDCLNDTDFDGVCDEAEVFGCTDTNASNYNSQATEEDNTCQYSCDYLLSEESYVNSEFDNTFSNYWCYEYVWTYGFYTLEEAISNGYACDCVDVPVSGCTDSEALNYDSTANQNDNSCEYDCDALGLTTVYINVEGGIYPSEVSWAILNSDGDELISDGVPSSPMQYCLDPSLCYSLVMYDSYGDGWNNNILEITGEGFAIVSIH